mmetsp:Transcript_127517/g.285280  ORF Transcript_127517/g.285280 Transcript_127517/m.285280 type:complete len:320 (-) Transcript_127517:110-1069(-)
MHPYCRLFMCVGVASVPCGLSLCIGSAHGEVKGIHRTPNHAYAAERTMCYKVELKPHAVSSQARYVNLVHHKTGTNLWKELMVDMQDILSAPCCTCERQCDSQCPIFQISHASEADARSISEVRDARVLHMVRRPSSMVVSEYLFASREVIGDGGEPVLLPIYVSTHTVAEGLMKVCDSMKKEIEDMVQVRSYFAGENSDVLEVSLEEIESNYDGVMRSIYQHFLGENDSRIDALLTRAKDHDLNRINVSSANTDEYVRGHVSGQEETAAIEKEIEILLNAQKPNPCLEWVMQMDERMGYGSDSSSSRSQLHDLVGMSQ